MSSKIEDLKKKSIL